MRSRSDLNVDKRTCTSSLPWETEQQDEDGDVGVDVAMLFVFCSCGRNCGPPSGSGVTRRGRVSQKLHEYELDAEYVGVYKWLPTDESTSIGDCWKGFMRTGDGTGEGTESGEPNATGGVENMIGGGGIKEAGDPLTQLSISLLAPEAGEALVRPDQYDQGGVEGWAED